MDQFESTFPVANAQSEGNQACSLPAPFPWLTASLHRGRSWEPEEGTVKPEQIDGDTHFRARSRQTAS